MSETRELKFRRLATELRAEIRSGLWAAGAKLPTEQEISRTHGVSLTTVRRAVDELVEEGLVVRRQGAGTFMVQQAPAVRGEAALVGVVVPDTTLYYPKVLEGIEEALTAAGARLMLACSRYRPAEEEAALRRMLDSGVDGLLVVPTLIGRADPAAVIDRLTGLPVPAVLIERGLDSGDDPSEHVRTDHVAGGYAAVLHLAALGHTRLALLTRSGNPTSAPVGRGFEKAVADLGLWTAEPFSTPQSEWSADVADGQVRRVTSEGATAVVCFGDREAIMVVSAARRVGLAVPEDLAIVAYDDEIAELAEVPLTAVSPPKRHLGRHAAELLLRRLREPDLPRHQVRLRPGIVVRQSCGASLREITSD
ncbi:DNA-binding LacI/PurR family transcriptional regulator [Streptosporangium album]|uniref:DNA-binding LacI/PurR family transcriptional regulator n=1 Tax=Streptosporangium album TaxID=47479 RepID=A0A7W7S3I7_9ACTN|nr:substrate-binding domain-containing protein [Streptosporangium album]MBB4942563.1 DNA-binding LacI/PurR family transcriptional regulator [Streptosporangium album]